MKPEPSKVRRLIDLVAMIDLDQATAEGVSELEALINSSEALRVLYLEIIQIASLAEDAVDCLDCDVERGGGELSQLDREVMAELFEEALQNRRLSDIREQAQASLLAEQARDRALDAKRMNHGAMDHGPRVFVISKPLFYGLIAASLLIVAGVLFSTSRTPQDSPQPEVVEQAPEPTPDREVVQVPPPPVFAQVVGRLSDRWADPANRDRTALSLGEYQLLDGFVQLRLHDGAQVLVQGPAQFQLHGGNMMSLVTGQLVAEVPASAVGFTVDTRTARIVDIGTEFGVSVGQDGPGTHLQVYRGEVRAASKAKDSVVGTFAPLYESQAMEFDAQGVSRQSTFEPDRYERDLYALTLRPTTSKQALWREQMPSDLRRNQSESEKVQVFLEHRNLLLESNVTVDFNQYKGWPQAGIGHNFVASGQRVDVYLLHLDSPANEMVDITASIEFGRPILGVIGASLTLNASDALFAKQGVLYSHDSGAEPPEYGGARGIDLDNDDDRAWITSGGQTLKLDIGSSFYIDQLRVIVLAAPAPEPDPEPDQSEPESAN